MKRLCAAVAVAVASPALAGPMVIDDEAFFPEGPSVVDGALYYVEYAGQTLMRWDGETLREVWRREGCGPSAAEPFHGDFLITCYDSGEIARVSMTGETVAVVSADANGDAMVGPNDFAPDGEGGMWMTASGPWDSAPIAGVVYHISADMAVRPKADDLHYANGVAQMGDVLYVAESEAGRIVAFDVGPGAALSNRRRFVQIGRVDDVSGPWAYPDGIQPGPDGNLWIGSYAMGRLIAVTPEGDLAEAIDVPGETAPNLAFAPDGALYVVTVDQTGAAPYAGRVLRIARD